MSGLPDDAAILSAVTAFGSRAMTYVVANHLRSLRFNVRTDWVLRRLKRLEIEGKVVRVPSPYAVQICWAPAPTQSPSKDPSHV